MKTFNKAIKSRTVWSIVLLFVVGGVEAINGYIGPELLPYVEGVLGLAAVWFKVNPSQDY